jgi:hypothetical protein
MKIMLKSLESGITNDKIVSRLQPLLGDISVSDAALMKEMSAAVRVVKERKQKADKKPSVNSIDGNGDAELVKMMAELKSSVVEVKQVQQQQRTLLEQANACSWGTKFGCDNCKAASRGHLCNHCLFCKKTGHKFAACPDRQENQNNPPAEETSSNSNRSSSGR